LIVCSHHNRYGQFADSFLGMLCLAAPRYWIEFPARKERRCPGP
jgi:hypothetical protein